MRALLNYLVEPGRLLKALGITATLNELTFVIAPVAASLLGSVSPPFAIGVITLLGGAPLLLIPRMPHARAPAPATTEGALITPSILLWLFCAMAGGAAVGVIEVGAVALALDFGFKPELGIIFTLALCIASVCGGVWVSVRNRLARRGTVIFLLAAATGGAILVSLRHSVELSALGCIVVGLMIAPLGTYYSVVLDGARASVQACGDIRLAPDGQFRGHYLFECGAHLDVAPVGVDCRRGVVFHRNPRHRGVRFPLETLKQGVKARDAIYARGNKGNLGRGPTIYDASLFAIGDQSRGGFRKV